MKAWLMIGAILAPNPPADIVFRTATLQMTREECLFYREKILEEWEAAGIKGLVACFVPRQRPPAELARTYP